jgi:hypothetical protein
VLGDRLLGEEGCHPPEPEQLGEAEVAAGVALQQALQEAVVEEVGVTEVEGNLVAKLLD